MGTNKFDKTGKEIKVGDIIQRLYRYEIKFKDGKPYAHILDGSIFHLDIKEIGKDFTIVKQDPKPQNPPDTRGQWPVG